MRQYFAIFLILFLGSFSAFGQKPTDVLATTSTRSIKLSDLSPETITAVNTVPTRVAAARKGLLEQLVNERILDLEARSLGVSTGKLLADEKAKIPAPAEAQIKIVYDANRTALGDRTLQQARKQIVNFLRSEPEQQALGRLFARLKTKYKVVEGKSVNASGLAPTDVVVTINLKPLTAKDFEDFARVELFELDASLGDRIAADLDNAIYHALIADEARAAGTDAGAIIASEVTNKMKEFSDEERFGLEDALVKKLSAKYKLSILYKRPEAIVQTISIDDDPSTGAANAPVTIVMFSDFQCSACSATHPLLKKAIADYPGKIRFVVRDFPLESIHENGFRSALAANAANAQGKFFEFTEILYANQDALDEASLKKYAAESGLNVKQFEVDFSSEKTAAEVRKDMADGESYGVNSTPTIYINGVKSRDLSVNGFKASIERALKK